MLIWVKRLLAIFSGTLLLIMFFPAGSTWIGIAGLILNLVMIIPGKRSFGPFVPHFMLLLNTGLLIYGIFCGGNLLWALLAAVVSLFAWNTSLFLSRWPAAPHEVQRLYLRRTGVTLMTGFGFGFSTIFAQGKLSLDFWPTLFLMLAAGAFLLRLLREAQAKDNK